MWIWKKASDWLCGLTAAASHNPELNLDSVTIKALKVRVKVKVKVTVTAPKAPQRHHLQERIMKFLEDPMNCTQVVSHKLYAFIL